MRVTGLTGHRGGEGVIEAYNGLAERLADLGQVVAMGITADYYRQI